MELDDFQQVHPSAEILASFEEDESQATLDLLMGEIFADGELTREEIDLLEAQAQLLPFVEADRKELVSERAFSNRTELQEMVNDPEELKAFIAKKCGQIKGYEKRLAALRLVAETAHSSTPGTGDVNYCYRVGKAFGFDERLIRQIVRSVWEVEEEAEPGSD